MPQLRPGAPLLVALCLVAQAPSRSACAVIPLTTVRVASQLAQPLFVTSPPGDLKRVFVLEQYTGNIRIIKNGVLLADPFLTVHDLSTGNEQGLLGLALHPSFAQNGCLYVNFTDANGNTRIERFRASASNPDRADSASEFSLLQIAQPQSNHNGGWLGFGPDSYLYIGVGDGGNADDEGSGHDRNTGNAQSDLTRLGKLLRIDVDHGSPYAIPPDNPFAAGPSPRNEFWAKGVRNPWRCAFDRLTGELYIADVGQGAWEEIDVQPAGAGGRNYGWRKFEAFNLFNCPDPCDSSGLTRPVYAYSHGGFIPPGRCSITGGCVYRGAAMPDLQGTYFFADFCSNQIWSFKVSGGTAGPVSDRTSELDPGHGMSLVSITSFGEDAAGEIYVCKRGSTGNPTGEIYKIVPAGSGGEERPGLLELGVPRPNPARGTVRFGVVMPRLQVAKIRVLGLDGHLVATVEDSVLSAGPHLVDWDGRDSRGRPVPAGTYWIRLEAGGEQRIRTVTVLR